ncbi:teichoic acid transport system ATP-binding protein [Lachnospiraceae bacterium NK3A20]|nr:teichoic acid transport system ATP-binding protein [Lachnospiraceae bacterium NK3A20]
MAEEKEIAIQVSHVTKKYKLYERNRDRVIEALGLSRKPRYTEKLALNDVSMTVYKGETVGIIGTNGSGKSTILKIITGVLTQTRGDVTVNGRISALLELGAGFNMEYNGIDNIYLNGTMIGYSEEEIREKIPDILAFADIGEYIYQPVKSYSSGMFMRLAFAVAINIDPEILIVDEALAVGDVFFQAKCYRKFDEFKKEGRTVIFVSHDLSSISKYCDRVICLNQGAKLGEGSPKEMIDIYKQVLVGQYNANEHTDRIARNQEKDDGTKPLDYGSGKARIVYTDIIDDKGLKNSSIMKGTECEIRMRVEFYEDIKAPIFAFTIKNKYGVEITGTNTMFEKAFLEPVQKGDVKTISFRQRIDLQGGEYLISFGCTGYEGNDFTVYHRLYDALNLTVVSSKNSVGYYDMNSEITVTDNTTSGHDADPSLPD